MKAEAETVDKGAGRPRDRRIDAAILAATAELLVEVGYGALTMAAIAERAGTTKTALYRRWPGKAELVHEAAFPAAPAGLAGPSGDIAGDIAAMLAHSRDMFSSPLVRAALPGLIADMAGDPELNDRVMTRFGEAFAAVRQRIVDAAALGQVHDDVDPDRLVELVGGGTMMRLLLIPQVPLDDEWVAQTAAILTHGVKTAPDPR